MKLTVLFILVILSITTISYSDTIKITRFASEGLTGWESKSFKGATRYSLERENGSIVLKAHSDASASGLFKQLELDPAQHRYLRWSWRVAEPLKNGNEKTKGGDDYSARVYVVFPGLFFWQTRAINYVWASTLPKGETFPNPYTSNAMMVVVESGNEKAGAWTTEQRDILADYRRLFGSEPRKVGAIAVMTDSDNAGGEATAWYGDIAISTGP